MSKIVVHGETRPAGIDSGIDCHVCKERVLWITFQADGTNTGVCACRWTAWCTTESGKILRSTPLGKSGEKFVP